MEIKLIGMMKIVNVHLMKKFYLLKEIFLYCYTVELFCRCLTLLRMDFHRAADFLDFKGGPTPVRLLLTSHDNLT